MHRTKTEIWARRKAEKHTKIGVRRSKEGVEEIENHSWNRKDKPAASKDVCFFCRSCNRRPRSAAEKHGMVRRSDSKPMYTSGRFLACGWCLLSESGSHTTLACDGKPRAKKDPAPTDHSQSGAMSQPEAPFPLAGRDSTCRRVNPARF